MKLRLATPEDLGTLNSWEKKAHVISAKGADFDGEDRWWEEQLPRVVPWREILIAEDQGRPIGVVVIIDPKDEEDHYWGNVEADLRAIDIWIGEESDLGKGHGTKMMCMALERCFAPPRVKAVLIDPLASNADAIRFYERVGFKSIGRQTFGEDDCLVMKITRDEWRKR